MKNFKGILLVTFMTLLSISAFSQQDDFDKTLKEAEAGNVEAMYNLGILYANTEYGADKAIEWFVKAGNNGHIEAMVLLGQVNLSMGYYLIAYDWLSEAIENDDSRAMYLIGFMYENGLGITKDESKADEYYKSAEQKGTNGMVYIARLYYSGIIDDVPANKLKASFWLDKACQAGDEDACLSIIQVNERNKEEIIIWIQKKLEEFGGWTDIVNFGYGYIDTEFYYFVRDVVATPCEISFNIYCYGRDGGGLSSSIYFNPSQIKDWKINANKDGIYTEKNSIKKTFYDIYDGTIEEVLFVNNLHIKNGEKNFLDNMIEKLLILGTFCEE